MAEAKARFAELVRLAEDGDEVVLMRHGHAVAKLVPAKVRPKRDWDEIERRIKEIQREVKAKWQPDWPDAAHSQDWMYDEHGLPK
jgi:prevent-host-death family protein